MTNEIITHVATDWLFNVTVSQLLTNN